MFGKNKKIRELERRIEALERDSHKKQIIVVNKYPGLGRGYHGMYREEPVESVVCKILDHLGLKLEYNHGTPERVEIIKPSRKASAKKAD